MNLLLPADDRRLAVEADCAREPIHVPGAVQAAGLLVLVDPATGNATAAAAGDPPLTAAAVARLPAALAGGAETTALDGIETADGSRWSATLHRPVAPGAPALLDLEPVEDPAAATGALDRLGAAIDALAAAADIAAAATAAATHLRLMTGFDRVMAYRFGADWSGEVVGESLAGPDVDSFAGLRFPASDIPPQARALYRRNRVRIVADVASDPVPLAAGAAAAPLDLSASALRAVSPVHIAYLANMGVRASMSVAIAPGERFWGLLACHHVTGAHPVGPRVRQAADLLGRALASRIAELEASERSVRREALAGVVAGLNRALADGLAPVDEALAPLDFGLRAAADADAFVLLAGGRVLHGEDPSPGLAAALTGAADGAEGWESDMAGAALAAPVGPALASLGIAGVLARRIAGPAAPGGEAAWAVWLRPELPRTVTWAGNPDKNEAAPAPPGALPRLTPRRSFAAWRELVRGRSEPFTPADRAGAAHLREALREVLLRRWEAEALQAAELRRRNEAIRFFADAAVHDLREPLWQIQVFAGALLEELAPDAETAGMAGVIEASARRMRELLDELAAFAVADAGGERLLASPLGAVVADATEDMAEQLRESAAQLAVTLPADLPPVMVDPARLRRVFQNLFSNAIKYAHAGQAPRIAVEAGQDGRAVRCRVRDEGIGLPPAECQRIFEPFVRLERTDGGRRDGLGLGLAICRRIMEGQNGSIVARAIADGGAEFELTLPLAADEPP